MTFLFTDIERSTRMWESAPDAMRSALERHDALLRQAIEARGGYVFSTGGDGFGVAFGRARDGLDAAVSIQAALGREPWPDGATIRVRMGLHTGEATERDGDYFGPALNRAARLMAVAHGGQVLCTNATAALAGEEFVLRDLGEHRLRDLAAPERVFQTGRDVFPALRSVDAVPTNLPTVRTELIGRSDDLVALSDLVGRERLVTLTGTGGVGKTRLALGVAANLAPAFADGCFLIELAPVSDSDEVATAVTAAMRAPTTSTEALVSYLSDRRMLLLLDNCEHVLDASADLVDAVVAAAPEVHVLVTSREPLGLEGEQIRRVQSLGLPHTGDPLAVAASSPAIRLFEERARAANESFRVDTENLAAVVEICQHLDGIPLAIELAAARSRSMAPTEIARRLDERFRLLAGGSRRAQERHRTLLATVSWSHDLLGDDDRTTFRRLSVFPASFDLRAAEAVVGDGDLDVVDSVLRLVDRSLVAYEPTTDRYRLLETLRQFGADRLAEADETAEVRESHARHFLAVADRLGPTFEGADYHAARTEARADAENLRATADWCIETDRWHELATMCQRLWYYLEQDSPSDSQSWYPLLLDHAEEIGAELTVAIAGDFSWLHTSVLGNSAAAIEMGERSDALAQAAGIRTPAVALNGLAQAELYTGRLEEALRDSERALHEADELGDTCQAVTAGCIRMVLLEIVGQPESAAEAAADALRRAEELDNPILISAAVISMLGIRLTGRAEPDFEGSLAILSEHDLSTDIGGLNDAWRDLMWGMTLLGLNDPGGSARLARAARGADRGSSGHVLDASLRQLAVAADRAGLTEEAVTLVAYAEEHLRHHRFDNPGQVWMQAQVDEVLTNAGDVEPRRDLNRREVMALVDEVELALRREE